MNLKAFTPILVYTVIVLVGCQTVNEIDQEKPYSIINASFESIASDNWNKIDGWSAEAGSVSDDGYAAPVHGENYAITGAEEGWITQDSELKIESGVSYTLKAWVRSINQPGNTAKTIAELAFMEGDEVVKSITKAVNVQDLKGIAATYQNDDGGNVWIDQGYRHQFADAHFVQDINLDPIDDPWDLVEESPYQQLDGLGWAVGNVIAGDKKFVYGTLYTDVPGEFYSSITSTEAVNNEDLTYSWTQPEVIIDHEGSEFPWVLDAHLFFDEETERLWLTWGGGIVYVTEMDPSTGGFLVPPADTEYDTHPADMHTAVATWPETDDDWCGDQWSSCWMEGASIYKYAGYWYFFGSYGNLGANYTIRVGRGKSPTGPYFDKNGVDLMEYNLRRDAYGQSMLLGDEGEHRVPGHPHIWEENGDYYMGYDYRKEPEAEPDLMGIRRLYWVDGWPTVWTPIEVTLTSDDVSNMTGKSLSVAFRNAGSPNSVLALDHMSVEIR